MRTVNEYGTMISVAINGKLYHFICDAHHERDVLMIHSELEKALERRIDISMVDMHPVTFFEYKNLIHTLPIIHVHGQEAETINNRTAGSLFPYM